MKRVLTIMAAVLVIGVILLVDSWLGKQPTPSWCQPAYMRYTDACNLWVTKP